MKRVSFLLVIAFFALAVSSFAQGGKAEPNRIKFAKGKSSTVVTGRLKGDEQYEFVFGAKKGQTVYVTNPDSDKFSYRVFSQDIEDVNYESTDLAEPTLEFVVPETGDYMIFVKRNATSNVAKKFSITLAIK
ncbi:MAG: hypothetical protein ACKVQJ_14670 [Pyrinomonadaceae bacterium]